MTRDVGLPPLLLTAQEAARGSLLGAASPSSAVATAAFGASRVAALFASSSGARVQLGVFHVSPTGAACPAPTLVDLLSSEEQEQQQEEQEMDGEDAHSPPPSAQGERSRWTLAWSPDGSFLLVSGAAWRGHTSGKQAAVWVYARSQWTGVASAPSRAEGLLLRAYPSDYVSAKQWKPSASIAAAFFLKTRLFLLSSDAVLLAADVQTARLAILAADDGEPSKEEAKGVFKMRVAKEMAEWHAGVTAACFDAPTATLVVSGGVRSPSEDLVAAHASSLSVWRLGDAPDAVELLDYTMVLNPSARGSDADAALALRELESGSKGLVSGLLQPLKFLVGAGTREDKQSLSGSIQQLALATDGRCVAMLDADGKLAVRQVDTCADVVAWQPLASLVAPGGNGMEALASRVKSMSWLTRTHLALLLERGDVVYAQLALSSSDGEAQDAGKSVEDPVPSALRRVAGYYYAPTLSASALEQTWRVDALSCSRSDLDAASMTWSAVVSQDGAWVATVVQQTETRAFVERLVRAGRVDDALVIAERHGLSSDGIDVDALHRRVWAEFCRSAATKAATEGVDARQGDLLWTGPRLGSAMTFLETRAPHADGSYSFPSAMHHLAQVKDRWWVLDTCLGLAAADSFDGMKQLLATGLDAASSLSIESTTAESVSEAARDELAVKREQLRRSIYRLDTLRLIVQEEAEAAAAPGDDALASDMDALFHAPAFLWFTSNPLLDTATSLARQGRVAALGVLFRRHACNLLPERTSVLSKLPGTAPPASYAHLLPAIPRFASDAHFYSLREVPHGPAGDDAVDAVEVRLLPDNYSHDLTAHERARLEAAARQSSSERGDEYAAWFRARVLDLDSAQGQLDAAFQLSRLASSCLAGWAGSGDARHELDEFLLAVERLHTCVYQLPPPQLPECRALALCEWVAIPYYQQAMMVLGPLESVPAAIERLRLVVVAQRRGRLYALDELLSWIAQSVLLERPSLASLELCARLIERSNPSLPRPDRWVQSDSHLLRTAISVVSSAQTSSVVVASQARQAQHSALSELLWRIFQSLPVRRDDDPPDLARLQAQVDEMEDLLVAMDVLAKYGILTTPCELKKDMLAPGASNPREMVAQMCQRALAPAAAEEGDAESSRGADGSRWMDVWQDAVKLQQHVFGERLAQDDILDTLLTHLSAHEASLPAARDLAVSWVSSNVEATDHVMRALLAQLQARLDSPCDFPSRDAQHATDAAVAACVETLRAVAALPAVQAWDPHRSERLEELLQAEMDVVHASQLLAHMSRGHVAPRPSQLRALSTASERLELVVQVLTSDPSNYQPSLATQRWLEAHELGSELFAASSSAEQHEEPLPAVMLLARLLHVDAYKNDLRMKGAYAALYCSDFDVAYALTMAVIHDDDADGPAASAATSVPLLHVLSLVLDLVSAASFRSWGSKTALCRAVLSLSAAGDELFTHQVTDLLLLWLQKLEAASDLALELGLSEIDVDTRLASDTGSRASLETVLLQELETVVGLLQHEERDRAFLLRLLQKGFHLQCVAVSFDPEATASAGAKSDDDARRQMAESVARMARLCVEEGVDAALAGADTPASDRSASLQLLELGFGYLLLWNDLHGDADADAVAALYESDLLPRVFEQVAAASARGPSSAAKASTERVLQRFHHFFLYAAAAMDVRGCGHADDNQVESSWRAKRDRLGVYAASYESLRGRTRQRSTLAGQGDDGADGLEREDAASVREALFRRLAVACQAQLASQQESHEMEQLRALFPASLDVAAFVSDEQYRSQQILQLATRRETFRAACQLADKYRVDPFQCVLAYIHHALLPPPSSSSPAASTAGARHEQLERALHTADTNFLELALQRPATFGDFLLRGSPGTAASVYDSLDGTDHVGVLLALRMVLDCAKRAAAASGERPKAEEEARDSLFPLPKASVDRATLVFMCMKRLKDQLDARDEPPSAAVDLKRVCRASTSQELLMAPMATDDVSPSTREARAAAVQAVAPLLTDASVKTITKVLQKLHAGVTPSAVVSIYLSARLDAIWAEHEGDALSSELAAYAYEACLPFLPVLSNAHLARFVALLLGSPRAMASVQELDGDFYGQRVDAGARFAPLMDANKRVDMAADALRLLTSRFETRRASVATVTDASPSPSRSQRAALERATRELEAMQTELVDASVGLALALLQRGGDSRTSWDEAEAAWRQLRVLETDAERRAYVDRLVRLLFHAGGCSASSSRPLVLIAELLFFLVGASEQEAVAVLDQSVRAAVVSTAQEELALGHVGHGDHWPELEALAWATDVPGSHHEPHEAMTRLSSYLSALTLVSSADDGQDADYYALVQRLGELSSPFLSAAASVRLEARAARQPLRLEAAVATAALSAWRDLLAEWEARGLWAVAAVASRLLLRAVPEPQDRAELAARHFGLQTRAVWRAVCARHPGVWTARSLLLEGSPAVAMGEPERFARVFEDLLGGIEASDGIGAQTATRALANVLVHRSAASGSDLESSAASAWAEEQRRAVSTRVDAQFGSLGVCSTATTKPGAGSDRAIGDPESARLWASLLVRGAWPPGTAADVVDWYEQLAFGLLQHAPEAVEQFVTARWETHRLPALLLLLMSPLDELRARLAGAALAAAAQLLLAAPSRCSARLLELLLLRFDVPALFHASGVYPSLVRFLLHPAATGGKRWPRLWTSQSEYVVCALVAGGERAAAGRVACALWRVHPMLWDAQSARLALDNLVRAMAAASSRRSASREPVGVTADERRRVLQATRERLERERLL